MAIAVNNANGAKIIIKCLVPQIEYGRSQLAIKAIVNGALTKIINKIKFSSFGLKMLLTIAPRQINARGTEINQTLPGSMLLSW